MATIWTKFMDMHSGGGLKEPQQYIYIEADEEEAVTIFFNRFGHNPHRISCTCCGPDYSIDSGPLDQVTAYNRGCAYNEDNDQYVEEQARAYSWHTYQTLQEHITQPEVLLIPAEDIKPEERRGNVPEQG